jgi:hypothetical protein
MAESSSVFRISILVALLVSSIGCGSTQEKEAVAPAAKPVATQSTNSPSDCSLDEGQTLVDAAVDAMTAYVEPFLDTTVVDCEAIKNQLLASEPRVETFRQAIGEMIAWAKAQPEDCKELLKAKFSGLEERMNAMGTKWGSTLDEGKSRVRQCELDGHPGIVEAIKKGMLRKAAE